MRKKKKKEMFAYILHFQANFSLIFRSPLKVLTRGVQATDRHIHQSVHALRI